MTVKLTIEECQQVAENRGGKCLSEFYINNSTKMEWICKNNHIWKATFQNIKNGGTWCTICSNKSSITIEECQKVAESRGGICLSKVYMNCRTNMRWQCADLHEWEANFHRVKHGGTWCRKCADKPTATIKECQKVAESRGGICLCEVYINCTTKMRWQCSELHEWEATFSKIKTNKTWCPVCAKRVKLTIEECQQFAESKGGKCLSSLYKTCKTKMMWECKEKHIWSARFDSIKIDKTWCPMCRTPRSEELAISIIEELLPKWKFTKTRPDFLKNPETNCNLELDGYNAEGKLAIEYQGKQHYEHVLHFHKDNI
jgi:predicted metalloprotease